MVTDSIPDDVEYLFWVGCAGALDERARKATQATARMLHRAGVTFAILGPRESCTGDPARRLGNEYLYQEQAKANVSHAQRGRGPQGRGVVSPLLQLHQERVPGLGGDFEVIHHTQLLEHLVSSGRLTPGRSTSAASPTTTPATSAATTGSSTSPGRSSTPSPASSRSRCAGAGSRASAAVRAGPACGWRRRIGKRINMERTDEALGTGADVVSTACPYCMIMLDDAVRANAKEDEVRVLDLSQVVEESLSS